MTSTLHQTLATALVLLLITPLAAAYTGNIQRIAQGQESSTIENELDALKEAVNTIDAPGLVNTLIGDQRIQLHLNLTTPDNTPDSVDDQQTLSVTTNGIQIEDIQTSTLDNPTLDIWAEQDAIETITAADSPFDSLQEQVKDGSIDYTVHGLLNKLRFGTAKLLFTLFT